VATSPHNKGDRASVELTRQHLPTKLAIWFGTNVGNKPRGDLEIHTMRKKISMFE
jgi:hypothetical protein